MSRSYTSSLTWRLHGGSGTALFSTLLFIHYRYINFVKSYFELTPKEVCLKAECKGFKFAGHKKTVIWQVRDQFD
jgi:hypothetical protein